MTFEQMQEAWQSQERRIETLVRLNRDLLRERAAAPFRSSLHRHLLFATVEAVVTFLVMLWTGSFLYAHLREPEFLLPGLLLHAWLTANFAVEIYEIVLARSIDYSAPVPDLQKRLARLCSVRVRCAKWALLTGLVVWWIPFVIVACKGLFGVDLYRIMPLEYLLLQVAAGVLLIPLILWGATRVVRSRIGPGLLGWVVDVLEGSELKAARRALDDLARFENGPNGGAAYL